MTPNPIFFIYFWDLRSHCSLVKSSFFVSKLTGAKRREFSGMIHFITSKFIIPATPFSTHPFPTFRNSSFGWWFGTCFIFPYIGNKNPNWLLYFSEGFKPPTSHLSLVNPIMVDSASFVERQLTGADGLGRPPNLRGAPCQGSQGGNPDGYRKSWEIPGENPQKIWRSRKNCRNMRANLGNW